MAEDCDVPVVMPRSVILVKPACAELMDRPGTLAAKSAKSFNPAADRLAAESAVMDAGTRCSDSAFFWAVTTTSLIVAVGGACSCAMAAATADWGEFDGGPPVEAPVDGTPSVAPPPAWDDGVASEEPPLPPGGTPAACAFAA